MEFQPCSYLHLEGFLGRGVRLFVRQGPRACWGSSFSALSDRGFVVFGALGGVVVIGVRDFVPLDARGSRFWVRALKIGKKTHDLF